VLGKRSGPGIGATFDGVKRPIRILVPSKKKAPDGKM
jgi:hypothetical protein